MPNPDRSQTRALRLTWGLATLAVALLAAMLFFGEQSRRIDDAQSRLETETAYLAHMLQIELVNGDYEQARIQAEAWGRLNGRITEVALVADNGFVLAEFRREMPGVRTHTHTATLPFSYRDGATLRIEESLEGVHDSIATLAWQLAGALVIVQLIALVLFHQFSRYQRQVRLTQAEYERRLEAQHALERMATSDALTGLPNRYMLDEQLGLRISEATRFNRKLALLFIDLDNFKTINDSFGHDAGDALLKSVAERILTCLRAYDMLARFGGDEFVVLVSNVDEIENVELVAEKIIQVLSPRITVDDHELYVSASVGISFFPGDGDSAGELLRKADAAMYTAKEAGRNCYRFFTEAMNATLAQRHQIELGLREALALDQLHLVYQPVIEIATGRIVGCEALLRWHTADGELMPETFLSVAEQSAFMQELQAFVIDRAVAQRAAWLASGIDELRIDINVSGTKRVVGGAFEQVERALARHGVDHSDIGIEFTEHALVEASTETIGRLSQVRTRGTTVSLDDFGTGYSSLGYLKDLPVDVLKIDRAFFQDLANNETDRVIVEAIIAMARSVGKKTLAEGIETQAQLDFARRHGCDLVQGRLLYEPMTPEQLQILLQTKSACVPASGHAADRS